MVFINLMREKRNRKKVWFTLFAVVVSQILANVPVYGVNSSYLGALFASSGVLGFVDGLSGGSASTLSMGAFGVTSYITASIILQLAAVIVPKLETMRKDGERGRKRYEKAEYVFSFLIALAGSVTFAVGLGKQGLLVEYTPAYVVIAIACWMAGGCVIILLGKAVEEHGIGNGISIILTCNILSRMPENFKTLYDDTLSGMDAARCAKMCALLAACFFGVYLLSVYLQCGAVNVPLRQARKRVSILNEPGTVPVCVNIANVLPVIYAASVISLPQLFVTVTGIETNDLADKVLSVFTSSNWYSPDEPYQLLGLAAYVALLAVMGLFSSSMTFNPAEIADHMKKNGNVVDGVNPGQDTVNYFERRRKVMSALNVVLLGILATVPDIVCARLGITQFNFLGTSLVIVVSAFFDIALRIKGITVQCSPKNGLFAEEKKWA